MLMVKNEHLGQHFLTDKSVLDRIISEADIDADDVVLEIGAGKGLLTRRLSGLCSKVIVIEKDPSFRRHLETIKNTELIFDDALKAIDDLEFDRIVANIPYYISEPLIRKVLRIDIKSMVLLVGKRFAEKISSGDRLSAMIACFYDMEQLQPVSRSSFDPPPHVDSILLKFIRKDTGALDRTQYILRELILQSDKKVKNALRDTLMTSEKIPKKAAVDKMMALGLRDEILNKSILSLSEGRFRKLREALQSL